MNRRQLLMGALATATLAAGPLAFAGVSPKRRRAMLGEAWERAAAAGVPLLVVVVPSDNDKWDRGRRLGIWLNNAPDADLAPMGRLEVAAAELGELDRLVPGVGHAKGAWMVLVRVDQDTPTWRSIVVPEAKAGDPEITFEDFVIQAQERGQTGMDWEDLQIAYREAIRSDGKSRLSRELQAFRASAGRVMASEGLAPADGEVAQLAARARRRWVKTAPPGTHWASSWGCGTDIEPNAGDDPQSLISMVGCGMGHVEPYAARFLHFWDVAS